MNIIYRKEEYPNFKITYLNGKPEMVEIIRESKGNIHTDFAKCRFMPRTDKQSL